MNGWMDEWMNELCPTADAPSTRATEATAQHTTHYYTGTMWYEWMDGWMNEWVNEWMDGWMNEWVNEWMDGWSVLQQTYRALEQQRLLPNTPSYRYEAVYMQVGGVRIRRWKGTGYVYVSICFFQKICSEQSPSSWWLSDAVHIGLVLYLLSAPSVRYALWLLVHKLSPRHRYHGIILWLVRILVFAQMLKITRATDQWLGVTQRWVDLSFRLLLPVSVHLKISKKVEVKVSVQHLMSMKYFIAILCGYDKCRAAIA